MAKDTRRRFLAELAKVEPAIAQAFQDAIQGVRSTAQITAIDAAIKRGIETGDVVRAVQQVTAALQLGGEFFGPLDRAIVDAYVQGGAYQAGLIPKRPTPTAPRLVVRFDTRNPRAEAWTRRNTGRLITEITADTEKLIRTTITAAIEANRPYRSVTRSLVGRLEGNQRVGGLIGLHSRQAQAVSAARGQLEALDAGYFARERRDRRFDAMVRKAIADGKPLGQADIDRITGRYSDRLLKLRGDTIARSEGNKAMQAGRTESVQQMIDSGKVPEGAVTKVWEATPGPRTRDSHAELNGTELAWGEKFISPATGFPMEHPHDENAPPEDVVNCRCGLTTRVDYTQIAT